MAIKMRADRLRNMLAMLLMGAVLTLFLPWLAVQRPAAETQESSSLASALPAGFGDIKIQPLSEALPQCYRVEDTEGEILALTPQELLIRLAAKEWAEWTAGQESLDGETAQQALALRMILLHGKALGLIGDRVEGMSGEELIQAAWLQGDDLPMMATQEILLLPDEVLEKLNMAADIAVPYFLSVEGMLVRGTEELTLDEIYNRMSAGETAAEIVKESFGESCILEQAKQDLS